MFSASTVSCRMRSCTGLSSFERSAAVSIETTESEEAALCKLSALWWRSSLPYRIHTSAHCCDSNFPMQAGKGLEILAWLVVRSVMVPSLAASVPLSDRRSSMRFICW